MNKLAKELKHTPTPWDFVQGKTRLCHVETRHDNPVGAGIPVCSIPGKRESDASFIVKACNAFDRDQARRACSGRPGAGSAAG
jgi:hypothetical protein